MTWKTGGGRGGGGGSFEGRDLRGEAVLLASRAHGTRSPELTCKPGRVDWHEARAPLVEDAKTRSH
ncbi:hypothetical protein EYF80_025580 [Liparis tanakae]|uniref:Uncharacterized protein n=1 Tax=Liparis tanakae TaxID=230148 RepID=A0A4Z2HHA0_9TELE|nr:hypothetical protein EYF80_025580 [Liparis tanakae]